MFLVYAGWFVEEVEARGIGDVLSRLEAQPFGAWILIAVVVGLAAYGLYLLLAAWHLRLVATWDAVCAAASFLRTAKAGGFLEHFL